MVSHSTNSYLLVDVRSSSVFHGWSGSGTSDAGTGTCSVSAGMRPGEVCSSASGRVLSSVLFSHSWICSSDDGEHPERAMRRADLISLRSKPLVLLGEGTVCKYCHEDIATATAAWIMKNLNTSPDDIILHGNGAKPEGNHGDVDRIVLSLTRLPAFHTFVTPEWLQSRIRPDCCDMADSPVCVLHANWENREEFIAKHILGAQYVDLSLWDDPGTNNFLPPDALRILISPSGLNKRCLSQASHIVVYDGSVGIMASRAAIMLWALGFTNVCILSGGLRSWCKAEFQTQSLDNAAMTECRPFSNVPELQSDVFVDMDFVRAVSLGQHADTVIVSCCSWPEYVGQVSGYSYISAKGRIPTARWVLAGATKDDLWHWHDETGAAADWCYIVKLWDVAGLDRSKHIILYCGTGWRCSAVWFYLHALGYERVSMFDGGWLEWSSDPSNEIALGTPTDQWFVDLLPLIPSTLLDQNVC